MANRILWFNLATQSSTSLGASSAYSSLPATNLRDRTRSNVWRSKTGWNIIAGFNDGLTWTRGATTFNALLNPGNYATGALMASVIQTKMTILDGGAGHNYTVTYDAVTHLFTIACAASITITWTTGTYAYRSVGPCLGYADSMTFAMVNSTGTSHPGLTAAYHSREYVTVDLGSGQYLSTVLVSDHNIVNTLGRLRVQGDAASLAARGASTDAVATVYDGATLSSTGTPRGLIGTATSFTLVGRRYWRLLIEDVSNPDGYSEIGVLYMGRTGDAFAPSRLSYTHDLVLAYDEMSGLSQSDGGVNYVDLKPGRRVWSFAYTLLTAADRIALEAIRSSTRIGVNMFLAHDDTDLATVVYGFFRKPLSFSRQRTQSERWDAQLEFAEAIG